MDGFEREIANPALHWVDCRLKHLSITGQTGRE